MSNRTPTAAPDVPATDVPATDGTATDGTAAPGAEAEVQCPGCGLTLLGESPRPTAAWFCPRCDYPLFWATEPAPSTPSSSRARRRLPGTGGRLVLGAAPCWHCGEMAEPDDRECHRCAATLPKPRAPHVRVPEPYPVPYPVVIEQALWPFVASAACAGASIAITLTLLVTGG